MAATGSVLLQVGFITELAQPCFCMCQRLPWAGAGATAALPTGVARCAALSCCMLQVFPSSSLSSSLGAGAAQAHLRSKETLLGLLHSRILDKVGHCSTCQRKQHELCVCRCSLHMLVASVCCSSRPSRRIGHVRTNCRRLIFCRQHQQRQRSQLSILSIDWHSTACSVHCCRLRMCASAFCRRGRSLLRRAACR